MKRFTVFLLIPFCFLAVCGVDRNPDNRPSPVVCEPHFFAVWQRAEVVNNTGAAIKVSPLNSIDH